MVAGGRTRNAHAWAASGSLECPRTALHTRSIRAPIEVSAFDFSASRAASLRSDNAIAARAIAPPVTSSTASPHPNPRSSSSRSFDLVTLRDPGRRLRYTPGRKGAREARRSRSLPAPAPRSSLFRSCGQPVSNRSLLQSGMGGNGKRHGTAGPLICQAEQSSAWDRGIFGPFDGGVYDPGPSTRGHGSTASPPTLKRFERHKRKSAPFAWS